jgi:hypothetical protein
MLILRLLGAWVGVSLVVGVVWALMFRALKRSQSEQRVAPAAQQSHVRARGTWGGWPRARSAAWGGVLGALILAWPLGPALLYSPGRHIRPSLGSGVRAMGRNQKAPRPDQPRAADVRPAALASGARVNSFALTSVHPAGLVSRLPSAGGMRLAAVTRSTAPRKARSSRHLAVTEHVVPPALRTSSVVQYASVRSRSRAASAVAVRCSGGCSGSAGSTLRSGRELPRRRRGVGVHHGHGERSPAHSERGDSLAAGRHSGGSSLIARSRHEAPRSWPARQRQQTRDWPNPPSDPRPPRPSPIRRPLTVAARGSRSTTHAGARSAAPSPAASAPVLVTRQGRSGMHR